MPCQLSKLITYIDIWRWVTSSIFICLKIYFLLWLYHLMLKADEYTLHRFASLSFHAPSGNYTAKLESQFTE